MRRREQAGRWADFAATHRTLQDEVRTQLRLRGPPGNRDFAGQRVNNYHGGKDTVLALYYLWLTGELMIHHHQGFEHVYDFRELIAPPAVDYAAPEEEAEHFFAYKTVAFKGLITAREWVNGFSGYSQRRISRAEVQQWLQAMMLEVNNRVCLIATLFYRNLRRYPAFSKAGYLPLCELGTWVYTSKLDLLRIAQYLGIPKN